MNRSHSSLVYVNFHNHSSDGPDWGKLGNCHDCRVWDMMASWWLLLTRQSTWRWWVLESNYLHQRWAGACPTYGISILFGIWSNIAVLWFKIWSTNHNKILRTSRQCYCREVCKISLWSVEYVMNKSIRRLHWISNSLSVARAPDHWLTYALHGLPWLATAVHITTEA